MRIRAALVSIACATLLAGCERATQAPAEPEQQRVGAGSIDDAPAVILAGQQGQILGLVQGGDSAEGAVFLIKAQGLPPGEHGMHIHAVGRCEPPSFDSAGPHWNPDNRQHGFANPQGAHRGDLGNITVGADGRVTARVRVVGSRVAPSRWYGVARAMLDGDGASLVIHAQPDDDRTDPDGDSGERIACAVLGEAGDVQ